MKKWFVYAINIWLAITAFHATWNHEIPVVIVALICWFIMKLAIKFS